MKQTLQRRKMLSGAPAQARRELEWTLVGLQLLGLLSVESILASGKDPLSWSVAASLRMVRLAARDRRPKHVRRHGLLADLGTALKDTYVRRSSKTARNWPHKKNEPPAGVPKIRKANATEVCKAKGISQRTIAA